MTDLEPHDPAPAPAAEPWQARLEVLSLLLVAAAAVSIVARVITAYYSQRQVDSTNFQLEAGNWVRALRFAGQGVSLTAAAALLVAFLLITLGPGPELRPRGVLALRLEVVIGLVAAGLATFAAVATVFQDQVLGLTDSRMLVTDFTSLVTRLGVAAPLVMATAIAGYVAWSAFSTLGEARVDDGEADEDVNDEVNDEVDGADGGVGDPARA